MRRYTAHWILVLLVLITLVPATRADESDGGLVSVFAYGAGNRLLAMGGAGVALDDNADLFFINPATLGGLRRREFQAGHASLYGLGFNDEYALLAWPDHRWGVLGLGLRHFGVGGIEGRDDRNLLLDEDLSSVDQQMTLAFGRSFAGAWRLGAGLNLRRQELAGYSGGALGLDLGLQFRPAGLLGRETSSQKGLRAGIGLRNVVRPSIRLDQESVEDPTSLQIGLAHSAPLGKLWLKTALDMEKTENRSLRMHAGLELEYSLIALRLGWGYDRLGAGAGLRWRDLRVDYVFEDSPIEPVHRFGLSLRFGMDVHAQRQAALDAEDAALQKRLDEVFLNQRAERIESMLEQAKLAQKEGRANAALALMSTVLAFEPGHPGAVALSARCHVDIAQGHETKGDFTAASLSYRAALDLMPRHPMMLEGLARCLAAGHRRAQRSEALHARFAEALDAFGAGDFLLARDGFRAILDIEPTDDDAAAMLRRSEEALDDRITSLLEQASRFGDRAFFDEADELLAQVAALDDADPRLAALRAKLASDRRAAVRTEVADSPGEVAPAEVAIVNAARSLSDRERREIEVLYRQGLAAAEAGNRDDALRFWELVWSRRPGYRQVDSYLLREYLMRGMEIFASGRLEEAATLWEKALAVDPDDLRARGYLNRAREQLARSEEIFQGE